MFLIFLFPGQGSQYVGMGKDLCDHFSFCRSVFEEAEDALKFKLRKLCFEGPESELKWTQNTQPAILTVSVAAHRALFQETGLKPLLLAGHSVGEYSALVVSEALKFSDAVQLVRQRGAAMQEAVPVGRGAMAALLGVEVEAVTSLCQNVTDLLGGDEYVSPANFNGAGQIVVSGTRRAVLKLIEILPNHGVKRAVLLDVSAPFHCKLMEPAAKRMAEILKDILISKPKIPYIANVDAKVYDDEEGIADRLIAQIPNPVRWEESMKLLPTYQISNAVEIGPGKVLTGLLRRINKEIKTLNVEISTDLKGLKGLKF